MAVAVADTALLGGTASSSLLTALLTPKDLELVLIHGTCNRRARYQNLFEEFPNCRLFCSNLIVNQKTAALWVVSGAQNG